MITAALHLLAAALLCFIAGDVPPLIFAASLLLALLPDLDTPKSLLGRMLRPISIPIERRFGHRTATHSLLALGLVAVIAYLIAPAWWLVLTSAYASHLLLDLLIGVQGIMLFWPGGEWMALTDWRDNGPAPKVLLALLLPATLIVATWAQLAPLIAPQLSAVVAVANPIATPKPTTTPAPGIHLRFALPVGVALSAVRVKVGDMLVEGQMLAAWQNTTPTSWPMLTPPTMPTPPAAPLAPLAERSADRLLAEAQAARDALTTAQAAERDALIAAQQQVFAEAQRTLADAQRALGQLQPQHERDQQEVQHAVDAAHRELVDAQAASVLPMPAKALPEAVAAQAQRAAERIHAAEAALRDALDGQDRMRTTQGIARTEAEAVVATAQAELDALPILQQAARAKLDADQRAAQILAAARVASAQGQVDDTRRIQAHDAAIAEATATAIASAHQVAITAIASAHQAAATATALALPMPAPHTIVSHAAGRVVKISAEEQDGQLLVTLEVVP